MIVVTTAPSGSAEWHAARKGKLGGTAIANIILGNDPTIRTFGTAFSEWCRMTGRPHPEIDKTDKTLARILETGLDSEPRHRRWLAEDTDGECVDFPAVVQHDTIPYIVVCPDSELTMRCEGFARLVEMKAPTRWSPDDWDEGAPMSPKVQLAACMAVTGHDHGLVSGLVDFDVKWERVDRDLAFERYMLDVVGHFMEYHVAKDIPPDVTARDVDSRALKLLYPKDAGEVVQLDDCGELVEKFLVAKAAKKAAEEEEKLLKNKLAARMGTASVALVGDHQVTYRLVEKASYTVKAQAYRQMLAKKL